MNENLPIIQPLGEMSFESFLDYQDSILWHFVVHEDIKDYILKNSIFIEDTIFYGSLSSAMNAQDEMSENTVVMCFECLDAPTCQIKPISNQMHDWQESYIASDMVLFTGSIDPSKQKIFEALKHPDNDLISEGQGAKRASSMRLRRIVADTINRSQKFKNKATKIKVSGDRMTITVDKKDYHFDIMRDNTGWIRGAKPVEGHEKPMEEITKAIGKSFLAAHFKQVIEDSTTDGHRLIMLDYKRLDGGRRTRLVESYSYRYRASKDRHYFFGWNVEEGGIRSYIVDNIKGARITDQSFRPRFRVEVGNSDTKDGPSIIDKKKKFTRVVSKSVVERAHSRFELKGGYAKIIKRLGKSLPAPKKAQRKKSK